MRVGPFIIARRYSYQTALALDPDAVDANYNLGNVLRAQNRPDAAAACYQAAIAGDPGHVGARNNLGVTLQSLGRIDDAIACYHAILEHQPRNYEARVNLGVLLFDNKNQPDQAIACHREALMIKPDYPQAHFNLGNIYLQLGKQDAACASYKQAVSLKPDDVDALYNLGCLETKLGRLDDAIDCFRRALAITPDYASAYNNLGVALQAQGNIDEAIGCFRRAIDLQPSNYDAYTNLGVLLGDHKGRIEDAIACQRQAIAIDPSNPVAHYFLGNIYRELGQADLAVPCYNTAIALDPNHADALKNRAFAWLLSGNFDHGWIGYESRWLTKPPDHPLPQWAGEPSQGGTILLWSEQGLGDSIQLIRYAPLVAARGWQVVASVQPRLKRLFGMIDGITVIADGDPYPPYQAHCPFFSLPLAFQTDLDTIPSDVPYLKAEPNRTQRWRGYFDTDSIHVGIAWQGNPKFVGDAARSIPPAAFAPLSRIPGVRLYALHKDFPLDQAPMGLTVTSFGPDFDAGPDAFLDTAAIMTQLDLVVTSDTAVAHLAGALGVPVWLALQAVPEWRWMMDRDDSPWYPTMRLFRQTTAGDWAGVFARIATELRSMAGVPAVSVDDLFTKALAHHRAGRIDPARDLYARILEADPGHADALHLAGVVAAQDGRASAACDLIGQAIAIAPSRAEFHTNLATALLALGRMDDAVDSYKAALALNPALVDAYYNLGNVLKTQDRLDEAAASYQAAIALDPRHGNAYNNLGVTLQTLDRIDDAIACYETALAFDPGNYVAHTNLGVLLQEHRDQPDQAIACHRKALELKPDYADAHYNLGNVYFEVGQPAQAIACFDAAVALDPSHLKAQKNRAFALLQSGALHRGWQAYECRWQTRQAELPPPQWSGESAQGTILLWAEQGLGDSIQFIRYGRLLRERGWAVVAEVQKPLKRLLGSIPGITVIAKGEPRPHFQAHCSLFNLPLAFRTEVDTVPRQVPYLSAEPQAVDLWRDRITTGGFRVGIAWKGNPSGDNSRSIPLATFARLCRVPNVRLISLQKDFTPDQAPPGVTVETLGADFDDGPDAFIDTAAVMTLLDLVITSDTSIAHVAGALGVPVWMVTKSVPEWRWMLGRDDTPWYPTMRLFRQPRPRDWAGAFERVAQELERLAPTANVPALATAALRHHQAGRLAEALALYREILAIDPNDPSILNNLGLALQSQNKLDEAEVEFLAALRAKPDFAVAAFNLGLLLTRRGDLDGAVARFEHALAHDPTHCEAAFNIGLTRQRQGKLAEAVAGFARALAIDPGHHRTLTHLGDALMAQGRRPEAAAAYTDALRLKPDDSRILNNLGLALAEMGRTGAAIASYDAALKIDPGSPDTLSNLGNALKDQGALDEAEARYRQALVLKPDHHPSLCNLAVTLQGLDRMAEAVAAYQAAVAVRPDYAPAALSLDLLRRSICDWRGTGGRFVRSGPYAVPWSFQLYDTTEADQLAAAKQWAAAIAAPRRFIHTRGPTTGGKIKIGYISPDFREHATAYLTAEMFECHDRDRFEIVAYSYGANHDDPIRGRFMSAFDRFVDIGGLSDGKAADAIHDDGIDILVDLMGVTKNAPVSILAARPAPIQVNYLVSPTTMGADYMDYIIADRFCIPPGHEAYYSEQVVRLPDCYQPNDTKRPIAERTPTRSECGLPAKGFVFCSFNATYKLTPQIFDIWMRLLSKVPKAVLWQFEGNAGTRDNLRAEAKARGVNPERLIFAPRVPNPEHLARHRLADLFLDTLPCNAHTTASDALWAGLPVLTCRGDTFAGRVAASLLHAVGLPELVTETPEQYEALALRLATDPLKLRSLRNKLRKAPSTAPLFDTPRYTRNIEAAYARMWEIQCAGRAPQAFDIHEQPKARAHARPPKRP